MKRITSVFLCLLIFIIITACGTAETRAQNEVEDFFDLMVSGDVEAAEEYLTTDSNFIDVFEYRYLRTLNESPETKEYVFLYDMKIANGLGTEMRKKVEIGVEFDERWNGDDFEPGYVITSITIRGGDEDEEF